ncbi:MAG TPA: hypothetical protein G4O12_07505 [Dehalococcoidia bacterium]|nr:hypothetical protein [Dehalococcoidia bacterium]
MVAEKWSPQPYSYEELLSLDRLKRAVMSRVLDRVESMMGEEFPLSPERIAGLLNDEWQRAKEAVRSSPAAREAFRGYLEGAISDQLDGLIKTDKDELKAMGVAEKSL